MPRIEGCEAAEDGRADLVQPVLERRDDTEVAATAAECPEELLVFVGARPHELAGRGHELDGDQVVAGEPVGALEPARAAAERQPGHAGRRDPAPGRREPVCLRRRIELTPGSACAGAGRARLRVDGDLVHSPNVDDEPVVAQRDARDRMAAAADGKRGLLAPCGAHASDDVVDAHTARDRRGPPVDHRVEERAHLVVAGILGRDHLAVEGLGKSTDRRVIHRVDLLSCRSYA